jgi:hypothetical protein
MKMNSKGKIVNHNQVGGIESYVVDNGMARGSRVAWFNTGSGLRFKVSIDRGLDIVDAFYNQYSLAWLSHNGLSNPRPDSDRGIEWLTNFPGGLVTTCGLTHVGGPEDNKGLHGKYSNFPAELESIIQPELNSANPYMSICGKVRESSVFGPNIELKRTITCKLGESVIKIKDVVVNAGNSSAPHMILYHCNFGWPLVDAGTKIIYKGTCKSRGSSNDNAIFNDKENFKVCREPMESHRGFGEACGFIDPQADSDGLCRAGLYNEKIGLSAMISFKKEQLGCLTNWQHWGFGEYITGIEPGTNYPIGRNAAKENGSLIILEPGQQKEYELEIAVSS